jgi:hypothetical protein
MSSDVEALLVTGAVGAGKTSVGRATGGVLAAHGIAGAFVDLDSIAEAWPRQPGDPFGPALMLGNLRAMWRNFRLAGARRLVVAGVIESADDRSAHELALDGTPMSVCRLVAPVPVLQERVRQREPLASRDWHVARAAELTAILDLTDVADFVVDNEFGDPTVVAQTVLASAGWLNDVPADE